MMKYILQRAQEPSTYASISLILGGLGLHVPDEKFQAIAHTLAAIAALAGVFMSERPNVPPASPSA